MKPDPEAEAARWISQAEHDLAAGERDFAAADWSEACYHAEQVGQKALKAFLFRMGARHVPIHSVAKLAEECSGHEPRFREHLGTARTLDQYYVPTRYPDALASPALPHETYGREQAQAALDGAKRVLALAKELCVRTG
ncbi:MAG: HEPN domain-containing protein [bacterium]